MNRALRMVLGALVVGVVAMALSGCTARSERWEALREAWPEDVPKGGTPAEYRDYHEAGEAFEAMMAAENALAEPH